MNRIRRVKDRNYTTISNIALRDTNLSLKAKGFLSVVMGLPEDWDFSINGILSILPEGKTVIYSVIKELIDNNYCRVEESRSSKGAFAGKDYFFYEEPQMILPHTENPHTENPHTENPHTENPHTENRTQLNKDYNILKTEQKKIQRKEDTIVSSKRAVKKQNVTSGMDLFGRIEDNENAELTEGLDENGDVLDGWAWVNGKPKKMTQNMLNGTASDREINDFYSSEDDEYPESNAQEDDTEKTKETSFSVISEDEWRNSFDVYISIVKSAENALKNDTETQRLFEKYHPNADYFLTIEKSVEMFWGTEDGWMLRKRGKSKSLNMIATLKKAIENSMNIVYRRYR